MDWWFRQLTRLSWGYPGLSIALAFLSGWLVGAAVWAAFVGALWGIYYLTR